MTKKHSNSQHIYTRNDSRGLDFEGVIMKPVMTVQESILGG